MHVKTQAATGRAVLLAGLLTLASGLAGAAPTSSKFDPTTQLEGTTLQLNGTGTRYRVVFKVYDLALYTQKKVTTPEELLALPGPKRLSFVALREIPGTDLGVAFIKGLQANSSKEQVQKHAVSSTRLIDIFSGQAKLVPGDTFAMDFVPGSGTTFHIAGKPQGAPVGDAEFFGMVLKIWVGSSPVDSPLKEALLGLDNKSGK
ncbi:MAG: chalcone isomerase family protein [Pseudomonadota bacterium]